jgi:acetolactate synthase-1/2/3 large subunit
MTDLSVNYVPSKSWKASGNLSDIKQSLSLLLKAKCPVIHAGQGILYGEATDELKEFAELTQIPVMTTLAGKSAFPENHQLSLGTRANTATGPVVHYLNTSDVVFGIGCSFTKTHVGAELLESKTLIHSTNHVGDIDKEYICSQAIVGDAKLVLRQLIEEVNSSGNWLGLKNSENPVEDIKYLKQQWMKEWMPKLTSNEIPINPYRVIWELSNFVDPYNTIVNHESGSPRDQMSPFFQAIAPRSYIGWGKSTQLGYSLGLAMGSKMANPSKLSINVMGDYAFGMVGMDLETTVRENIPILTIILNNSYMAIYGPNDFPVADEKYKIKHLTGNYSAIAEAMGSYVEKIDSPDEIRSSLARAANVVQKGKPALLEFITRAEQAFSHKGS